MGTDTLFGRDTFFVVLLCKGGQQQRGWDPPQPTCIIQDKQNQLSICNKRIELCLPDYTAVSKGHAGDVVIGDDFNSKVTFGAEYLSPPFILIVCVSVWLFTFCLFVFFCSFPMGLIK